MSAQQRVYVLTLKTWVEWDRPHHTYGRIHWSDDSGYGAEDSESLPDEDGITTIRHETRDEAVAGARRWFAARNEPRSVLVCGTWGLCGWERDEPFDVLEGILEKEKACG